MKPLVVPQEAIVPPSRLLPFLWYWLPPLLLTAGTLVMAGDLGSFSHFQLPVQLLKFLLPSYPMKDILALYAVFRKVMHFLVYAVLCAAYARAWRWHVGLARWQAVALALLLCLLVSVVDEGRQAFFASRTGSPRDVLLDMSGALSAAVVLLPYLGRPTQPAKRCPTC